MMMINGCTLICFMQVGKKLEREKRLEQEAGRHWEEIQLETYEYDRYSKESKGRYSKI